MENKTHKDLVKRIKGEFYKNRKEDKDFAKQWAKDEVNDWITYIFETESLTEEELKAIEDEEEDIDIRKEVRGFEK